MTGLKYDFDINDLVIRSDGTFATAVIDNQNAALIALAQVCMLTSPEVGAQVAARLQNRKYSSVASVLAEAKRMIENDGGRQVEVKLAGEQLSFQAVYDE